MSMKISKRSTPYMLAVAIPAALLTWYLSSRDRDSKSEVLDDLVNRNRIVDTTSVNAGVRKPVYPIAGTMEAKAEPETSTEIVNSEPRINPNDEEVDYTKFIGSANLENELLGGNINVNSDEFTREITDEDGDGNQRW